MYAISSVNAGKYRAVADSLSTAFGGRRNRCRPCSWAPGSSAAPITTGRRRPFPAWRRRRRPRRCMMPRVRPAAADTPAAHAAARTRDRQQLQGLGDRIGDALSGLVQQKLVRLRQGSDYLEVEIQSDLLFTSGSALRAHWPSTPCARSPAVLQSAAERGARGGLYRRPAIASTQFRRTGSSPPRARRACCT